MCESSFLYSNQPERAGKQINQNALKQIKAAENKAAENEIIIIFESLIILIMRQSFWIQSMHILFLHIRPYDIVGNCL